MTIEYKDSKRIVGLEADRTGGSITLDAESNNHASASATSITISGFTVGNNSNKILIVSVGSYNPTPTVSGITWNSSENFTQINTVANNGRADLWYLVNPTSTTADIVVTYSSSAGSRSAGVTSLYNVNQSTPIGVTNTVTGTGGTIAGTITPTTTGSWIIDSAMSLTGLGAITDTLTAGFSNLIGGVDRSHGTQYSASPTINSANSMTWTNGQSSYAWAGAEIKKAEGDLTNVQDNSLFVDKVNARRYWFSKPTTFEQNFDSDTGHTANQTTVNGWYAEDYTKIAYDGTNHYLKYAAMGSTNWGASFDLQQSGNNGVGSAINSSKWTLRFKWHILTNSGSTSNGSQGAFGISSVPATTLNNQDFMGFSMRQHANGGEVGLFNAALDNNNPMNQGISAKKFVTGNLSAGTTYYAEIIRDGDKCTTTLRTGSHTGTQVGSMERTVTGISGLRYLYYKAQQDSASATHTSYIDDIDFINGTDTWTMEPTYPYSSTGWTATGGGAVATDNLTLALDTDGAQDQVNYDLTSISSDKFVLDFTLNFSRLTIGSNLFWFMGLVNSTNWIATNSTNHMGIFVMQESATKIFACSDGTSTWNGASEDAQTWTPSTGVDYYFRLTKLTSTTYKVELFSDSTRTSVTATSDGTVSSMTDLRYLVFTGDNNSGAGNATFTISDLKFYNGVTSIN